MTARLRAAATDWHDVIGMTDNRFTDLTARTLAQAKRLAPA